MRFCRISAVILAFAAIESYGTVNVTASRDYVDRKVTSLSNSVMGEVSSNSMKIKAIETNTYTKSETDARIIELAPQGLTTNDVCEIVTNMTALSPVYSQAPTFSEWTFSGGTDLVVYEVEIEYPAPDIYNANLKADGEYVSYAIVTGPDIVSVTFTNSLPSVITATRTRTDIIGYTLGTQTNSVLASTNSQISVSTITNIAPTRAEVEKGWWSEWAVVVGNPEISVEWLDTGDASVPSGWVLCDNESENYLSYPPKGDESSTMLSWTFGAESDYDATATRHRVAAPVPTKTSDLTNDIGFLTSHQAWSDVIPSGGIPATDLSGAVQTSLGKADSAVQPGALPALTNDLISASYIATNNPAFVAAVTNCPVVIADPGDISGWAAYGTVGALLAALAAAITGLRTSKEDASNKVASLSAQSTDAQYPSAKCVWDTVGDVEAALAAINGGSGT